ncbi:NAD(P)/FAD-dependent oxidoreductase [Hansschlegelia plantiphila]|uniref:FAD/NAD(P)-binding oxidoreductase n=1 Tax=Hansschlegelia plantiphila TaxID=374655 RepID=A0A9W6MVZ8_9HYPH|nr:NAD(P)/FAD-dependent oxidoreductase [Hansschlegelia plantiphila]GLK68322.1 FAD/NAD(P)-binding oxidoreductase [Hansschlegelia plantiphila]
MPASDVAIIGAGAVGCAMARRFALEGARVLLLEKGADLLSGASKANSAILHTGFDAPAGSVELACMQAGYAEYLEIRDRMNLPLLKTGAMVVAWSDAERAALDGIEDRARTNGVGDVRRLTASEIREREPNLSHGALEALLVPGEHVIDPWSPFLAYLLQAKAHGAEIVFDAEVLGGAFDGDGWTLRTAKGEFHARTIVNCAGLYGDRIERTLLGEASFEIRPRKGQFAVFDKAAAELIRTIVLPVPNERTKGVVLCRTAFGNVLVGPTAEEQEDRERATVEEDALVALLDRAIAMVPALADVDVTAVYAGLRPASEEKGYRIRTLPERNWITVGGIRSTGLTASLGIAAHVFGLYGEMGRRHQPIADPVWPTVANLAEHRLRDWARPGHGDIVCHCELVTQREIAQALEGPLPPGDFGGLKRRTRAGMGRCQGFNCNARLAEMTAGRFAAPLAADEAA